MNDTVRAALRSATHSSHMRLHAHSGFAELLAGKLSRAQYSGLLYRLLGVHAPIEKAISCYDHDPIMAWRQIGGRPTRSARIRQDLAFLGFDEATIASASDAEMLPPVIASSAAALGCAWVVEGSSLGGAVLGRKLASVLGLTGPEQGGAFFASGPDHLERWNECCAAIELCGTDTLNYAALEATSLATFQAFETWLNTP